MRYKEACVETIQEAIRAQKNGAQGLEFCAQLSLDGLTPPYHQVVRLLTKVDLPVKVMIRPRPGDFYYTDEELSLMVERIKLFRQLPIAGLVVGVLNKHREVDTRAMKWLVEAADFLPITFHKAIDATVDPVATITNLKRIPGIESVLTSGGAPTAQAGIPILKKMLALAGKDLKIIVAGKVTHKNLDQLHQQVGASAYHGRRIVPGIVE